MRHPCTNPDCEVRIEELQSDNLLYSQDLADSRADLRRSRAAVDRLDALVLGLQEKLTARTFEIEDVRLLAASREAKIIYLRAALAKVYDQIKAILAAPRHPDVIAAKEKS